MKNLIPLLVIYLMTTTISAQSLAKKPNHKSSSTTEFRADVNYANYIAEAEKQVSYNNMEISDIRFFIQNHQQGFNEKAVVFLNELQKENEELRTDLENFMNYGIGEWRDFQSEFNTDLKSLSADLDAMHGKFVHDYLVAYTNSLSLAGYADGK